MKEKISRYFITAASNSLEFSFIGIWLQENLLTHSSAALKKDLGHIYSFHFKRKRLTENNSCGETEQQ